VTRILGFTVDAVELDESSPPERTG
jgi:hypothetical protein